MRANENLRVEQKPSDHRNLDPKNRRRGIKKTVRGETIQLDSLKRGQIDVDDHLWKQKDPCTTSPFDGCRWPTNITRPTNQCYSHHYFIRFWMVQTNSQCYTRLFPAFMCTERGCKTQRDFM